jgi:sugar phosphate isomerase/epimerase
MKLGLINSAWLGSPIGTAEGIAKTKQIGFDTIDIFADPLEIGVRERRLIRDSVRDAGLPVISVCCVALGLIDFNASVRRFHLERCRRYLDLVYELEGKNLLLVLGEYVWQQEVIRPEDQWRWGVEAVRELGDYAAGLGLEIVLELEPFRLSLINSIEKMRRFLDEAAHPAVRANVDISHLVLVGEPPEAIRTLAGRIGHVHLSDCNGKVHGDLPPGRGVVNFPPYLAALQEAGFDGVVSIELEYSPEPDRILDWVTEAYRETDRLMRSLGLRG